MTNPTIKTIQNDIQANIHHALASSARDLTYQVTGKSEQQRFVFKFQVTPEVLLTTITNGDDLVKLATDLSDEEFDQLAVPDGASHRTDLNQLLLSLTTPLAGSDQWQANLKTLWLTALLSLRKVLDQGNFTAANSRVTDYNFREQQGEVKFQKGADDAQN